MSDKYILLLHSVQNSQNYETCICMQTIRKLFSCTLFTTSVTVGMQWKSGQTHCVEIIDLLRHEQMYDQMIQ